MAVGSEEVFLIFLIVILIISVVYGVYPVFSKVATNKCIVQQHTLLNAFDKLIGLAKERGAPIEEKSFLVMGCTDCIWYDSLNSQWVIKHINEEPINKSISYNVIGVAQNCLDCENPKVGDVECANMVADHTYNFEIGEDYVKCTNCPDSPNLCEYSILFSPRVEVADDVDDPTDNSEPITLVSYKNTLYLFYHKEGTNDIYYKTSTDGKNWDPGTRLTDGSHLYGFPSAGVFNDELYVGYSGELGDWEIFIKKFDGVTWTDVGMLTNNADLDGGPYFTNYQGKFYIFYHHGSVSGANIRYRICDSGCGVLANWGSEQEATAWGGLHIYPSVLEQGGKIHLSYSADVGNWEIFYKTCDDTNGNTVCDTNEWSSYEQVTTSPGVNGNSRLIVYDNRIYIFYHEVASIHESKVFYKAYDGGWQRECGAAGGKKPNFAAYPASTIHSDKINLCYIKYDTDWKISCQ